jgi:hypothetical protein
MSTGSLSETQTAIQSLDTFQDTTLGMDHMTVQQIDSSLRTQARSNLENGFLPAEHDELDILQDICALDSPGERASRPRPLNKIQQQRHVYGLAQDETGTSVENGMFIFPLYIASDSHYSGSGTETQGPTYQVHVLIDRRIDIYDQD